jgi:hypothetical protein
LRSKRLREKLSSLGEFVEPLSDLYLIEMALVWYRESGYKVIQEAFIQKVLFLVATLNSQSFISTPHQAFISTPHQAFTTIQKALSAGISPPTADYSYTIHSTPDLRESFVFFSINISRGRKIRRLRRATNPGERKKRLPMAPRRTPK